MPRLLTYTLITALLSLLPAAPSMAAPVSVEGIRLSTDARRTRVVLDLSRPTPHRLFTLDGPRRVVVDLPAGRVAPETLATPARGVVRRIRGANKSDGSVRLVLELAAEARPRSFALASDGRLPDRLVIDLESAPSAAAPPRAVVSAPAAGERDVVIAIDAGHGGKDPGARGPSGTREKDVVLAISRRLAEVINAEPGMRAVMTRHGDRFVHLRQRMETARTAEADLFLSVHADAFSDRRVSGATVYVLSQAGASDEAARRLAERENADLIGGVRLADKDEMLASVLMDLSQTAAISSSLAAGQEILSEISRVGKVRKRTVQQAPFLVLKSPDVPSVLIETAFISNPGDERRLTSREHQDRLARAIFAGVRDYFYANPPRGTRVARLASLAPAATTEHVIRRGDTLSDIANRYRVSVRSLRSANRLDGDRIRVGQVLKIPGGRGG